MRVRDIMSKNAVICSPQDTVSRALALMKNNRTYQVVVAENDSISGMVTLDRIVKRDVDPETTKVASLMVYCPVVSPEASLEEAAALILAANVRAVPVYDGRIAGIVSETDLLKNIEFKNSEGAAREAVCVSDKDNIGKVRKIMSYENLSRVPVLRGGVCVGIVGTYEMIKILESKKKFDAREAGGRDRGYREKFSLNETLATAVMKSPSIIKPGAKIGEIIRKIIENGEVIVEESPLKIITPKDILRNIINPKKMAYVQITGIEDDIELAEKIHGESEITLKKISKVSEVQPMKIHVKKHQKDGTKIKYSAKIQLPTQLGTFVSTKSHGWNALAVVQHALKSLEREFFGKYGKAQAMRKRGDLKKRRFS